MIRVPNSFLVVVVVVVVNLISGSTVRQQSDCVKINECLLFIIALVFNIIILS